MERLEAKVDELTEKVNQMEPSIMPGCGLPVKPKESKPTRSFADYIRVPGKADMIMAQLHKWIDGRQRVKAILYIKAAMEARVLSRPSYVAANLEFPKCLGGKSLYYAYTGEPLAYNDSDDLDEISNACQILTNI